jgi:hypothetical protein
VRKINWEKVLHSAYVDLYNNADPKVDYDKMDKSDFMSYEIDGDVMENIVKGYIDKYKMNKYAENSFRWEMYLGNGPKTKKND